MPIPIEAVAAAFPAVRKIGTITLKPFSLQHVLALRAIKHPLMDEPQKDTEGKPLPQAITLEDQLIALAVMAMDPVALANLLCEKADRSVFTRAAYLAAAEIPVEAIVEVVGMLQDQIAKGFSTFVPMRQKGERADDPLARA